MAPVVTKIIIMTIPKISDIDFDHFLQESMSQQHRSKVLGLELEASVGEIQDNMKTILGKVILKMIVRGTMVRFLVSSILQKFFNVL